MQFPCFNKDCQHNDKSESGCDARSIYTVDLCDSFCTYFYDKKLKIGLMPKLVTSLIEGLTAEAHHKQYYLEEVLKKLIPAEFEECKEAWKWEDGIEP